MADRAKDMTKDKVYIYISGSGGKVAPGGKLIWGPLHSCPQALISESNYSPNLSIRDLMPDTKMGSPTPVSQNPQRLQIRFTAVRRKHSRTPGGRHNLMVTGPTDIQRPEFAFAGRICEGHGGHGRVGPGCNTAEFPHLRDQANSERHTLTIDF